MVFDKPTRLISGGKPVIPAPDIEKLNGSSSASFVANEIVALFVAIAVGVYRMLKLVLAPAATFDAGADVIVKLEAFAPPIVIVPIVRFTVPMFSIKKVFTIFAPMVVLPILVLLVVVVVFVSSAISFPFPETTISGLLIVAIIAVLVVVVQVAVLD